MKFIAYEILLSRAETWDIKVLVQSYSPLLNATVYSVMQMPMGFYSLFPLLPWPNLGQHVSR